jgi:uncharacterized protein (DUF1697 family)
MKYLEVARRGQSPRIGVTVLLQFEDNGHAHLHLHATGDQCRGKQKDQNGRTSCRVQVTGYGRPADSIAVVFQSDLSDRPALARQLEEGIEQRFGFHSDILLRTLDEFRAVIRRNPLSAEHADPGKRVVMFLSASPAQDAIDDLLKAYAGPETIHITRQEAYLYYPDGQGRSKLSNAFIERKLNVSGTARNWNTVTRLLDLAERFKEP